MTTTDEFANQQTWQRMIRFYNQFLDGSDEHYLTPLCRLVEQIASSDRSKKFRAGQSMVTLIISTTSYHGLRDDDPYVSIEVHPAGQNAASLFDIGYHLGFVQPEDERNCDEANVLAVLDELLNRLWRETKSD